jgi:hypothetical protein
MTNFHDKNKRVFAVDSGSKTLFVHINAKYINPCTQYEGVSRSFQTDCLEQELQMVQLSVTRCSRVAILWVSLVSFATMTLCLASQQVFIVVVVYFIIDSVQKLLDTPSYM